jgi:hypothetical protein
VPQPICTPPRNDLNKGDGKHSVQHVGGDAGDDRGEPSVENLDAAGVTTAKAELTPLQGVIAPARGPQHLAGNRFELGPLLLDSFRQPFLFVHRSHSLVMLRQGSDGCKWADLARRGKIEIRTLETVDHKALEGEQPCRQYVFSNGWPTRR